jgi:hypothetical protein
VKTIKAGQAIKAHGSAPTCPAGPAGTIYGITLPASSFVGESDTTAINAAAAIISRRIARPPNCNQKVYRWNTALAMSFMQQLTI